jgi:UDP-N-acetyl-D-glucosamine dehydrogenase
MRVLNDQKKALNGAKVLVLGVAYKQDIDDYRESPALRVIEGLQGYGAQVTYFDPYVPRFRHEGHVMEGIPALTPDVLAACDLVMVTAAHTNVDYEMVAEHAPLVFDTKNAMKNVTRRENIRLL